MRILHTADWHLGDRLGRIDRTADLRRAVERVAGYCEQEKVDVLLVAGDLFSELSRPDGLRDSIQHLQEVFLPFLVQGGTLIAITGNHDNENFCQTLRSAMSLASPVSSADACQPGGRVYLAPNACRLRLADRAGHEVAFVLMPYPTPARYLETNAQRYPNLEEKNRALQYAFAARLRSLLDSGCQSRPTVLAAHLQVEGAVLPNLFRLTAREGLVLPGGQIPADLAYVALGHVHQPQTVLGLPHVRYCGSIERLDLGERHDDKSVVLFDIGPEGRRGEPWLLPLEATPLYEVSIDRPREDLPRLRVQYPDAGRALVRYRVTYEAGRDNLPDILDELQRIFPRWYDREWREAGSLARPLEGPALAHKANDVHATVQDYLGRELEDHPERAAVLELAEALLAEAHP